MTRTLARRVDELERRTNAGAGRVFVCWCGTGDHAPDCQAHEAGEHETLLIVRWVEALKAGDAIITEARHDLSRLDDDELQDLAGLLGKLEHDTHEP